MKHPDFHLTARTDIGPHRRGDHIEDKVEVEAILKGEHAAHFVRVAADNEAEKPADADAPQSAAPSDAASDAVARAFKA
jgi:hypothetical protein